MCTWIVQKRNFWVKYQTIKNYDVGHRGKSKIKWNQKSNTKWWRWSVAVGCNPSHPDLFPTPSGYVTRAKGAKSEVVGLFFFVCLSDRWSRIAPKTSTEQKKISSASCFVCMCVCECGWRELVSKTESTIKSQSTPHTKCRRNASYKPLRILQYRVIIYIGDNKKIKYPSCIGGFSIAYTPSQSHTV